MKRIAAACVALAVVFAPALCSCGKSDGAAAFTIDFLQTGKSDCILVRSDGYVILNDAADEDDYGIIRDTLSRYGITVIDCFIISHYDNDHIGAAYKILSDYKVGVVIAPDFTVESRLYKKLMKAVGDSGTPLMLLREDYSFESGRMRVRINAPSENSYDDKNNYSLITSLYYGDHSFLFAGDALEERMTEFNRVCVDAYTLVKLPHHGDTNKGLRVFLMNALPEYAVYTSEKAGEISSKLTSQLASIGTKLYSTAEGGVHAEINNGVFKIFPE